MFEFLISVVVLMVLAFPVIAIFALVRSLELSRLVLGLDTRLRALEQSVAHGVAPGAPAAPPANDRAAVAAATSRVAGAGFSALASPIAAAAACYFSATGARTGCRRNAIGRVDQF